MSPEACDFEQILSEERPQAKRLAHYLSEQFPRGVRIIDVGCGPGLYVEELRAVGFSAYGVDRDDRIPSGWHFHVDDVTATVWSGMPFDVAVSLEVGEHIPVEHASRYVRYLLSTGAGILYFSAAAPGQGGIGHINCQAKPYWSYLLHRAGFYFDPDETAKWMNFMAGGESMGWLLNNGMVFRHERGVLLCS